MVERLSETAGEGVPLGVRAAVAAGDVEAEGGGVAATESVAAGEGVAAAEGVAEGEGVAAGEGVAEVEGATERAWGALEGGGCAAVRPRQPTQANHGTQGREQPRLQPRWGLHRARSLVGRSDPSGQQPVGCRGGGDVQMGCATEGGTRWRQWDAA